MTIHETKFLPHDREISKSGYESLMFITSSIIWFITSPGSSPYIPRIAGFFSLPSFSATSGSHSNILLMYDLQSSAPSAINSTTCEAFFVVPSRKVVFYRIDQLCSRTISIISCHLSDMLVSLVISIKILIISHVWSSSVIDALSVQICVESQEILLFPVVKS
jgi:hypothetical protein